MTIKKVNYLILNFIFSECKKKRALKARFRTLYPKFSFQKLLQLQGALYHPHLLHSHHGQQIQ